MLDFDELRGLAADVRTFIHYSEDKDQALLNVLNAYDVVVAIYPLVKDDLGIHVVKGADILELVASTGSAAQYTYMAIEVPNLAEARVVSKRFEKPSIRLAA